MTAYGIVHGQMEALPSNTEVSKRFCAAWSGILCIDGKFVKIRGYEKKIPFIYGVDYHTHDIPCGVLAPSESSASFSELFSLLDAVGYFPRLIVGDDSGALRTAAAERFPAVPFQLCQTHYLENVRQLLHVRTDGRYLPFFIALSGIFRRTVPREERLKTLLMLKGRHWNDALCAGVIVDVHRRYDELFAYEKFSVYAPHSNNLIEAFNSHLNARLTSMKGFESFQTAALWLNAWILRRRTKPFTDCEEPFLHLNGKCSIEESMKSGTNLQAVFSALNM